MSAATGLLLLGAFRALVEAALLFFIGRGALAFLAGRQRHHNAVYQLFVLLTRPVLTLLRRLLPPAIIDRHLPWVGFMVLLWLWLGLAWLKQTHCAAHALLCG